MSVEGSKSARAPNPATGLTSPPDIEPVEDEAAAGADEPRTVLICGASGNIGRKLRHAWRDRYDLILIDQRYDPDEPRQIIADLSVWDESWVELFEEADAVVHLAANPDPSASWGDLVGPNLDALANVFLAAATSGIDRLVFASSNHAMGGYRKEPVARIQSTLSPLPDSPYGASKLWGERLGHSLAKVHGLSFVALRIGWVQPGENRPETLPDDDWSRGLWLSNSDAVQLFTRAVEATLEPGETVVVNGMSRNSGSRWDLGEARNRLGFVPEGESAP